jgi:hypothetical protein
MDNYNSDGPYILWVDGGYEGWSPRSYPTLTEALSDWRDGSKFVITKVVKYEVVEAPDDRSNDDA